MRYNSSKVHLIKFRRSRIIHICQVKKSLWGRTVAREGKKSTGWHLSHGLQSCIVSLIITRQIKTENENSSFYFAQGYFLPVLRNPHHRGFFFFKVRIQTRNMAVRKREVAVYHKKTWHWRCRNTKRWIDKISHIKPINNSWKSVGTVFVHNSLLSWVCWINLKRLPLHATTFNQLQNTYK